MTKEHEIELKNEIAHIFDSGANEIRIFEMVKMFLDRRDKAINYTLCCTELKGKEALTSYSKKQVEDAYDKGFKDAMLKYRK